MKLNTLLEIYKCVLSSEIARIKDDAVHVRLTKHAWRYDSTPDFLYRLTCDAFDIKDHVNVTNHPTFTIDSPVFGDFLTFCKDNNVVIDCINIELEPLWSSKGCSDFPLYFDSLRSNVSILKEMNVPVTLEPYDYNHGEKVTFAIFDEFSENTVPGILEFLQYTDISLMKLNKDDKLNDVCLWNRLSLDDCKKTFANSLDFKALNRSLNSKVSKFTITTFDKETIDSDSILVKIYDAKNDGTMRITKSSINLDDSEIHMYGIIESGLKFIYHKALD